MERRNEDLNLSLLSVNRAGFTHGHHGKVLNVVFFLKKNGFACYKAFTPSETSYCGDITTELFTFPHSSLSRG